MTFAVAAQRAKVYAGFVKLEHTIFSLPLIYAGALVGAQGSVSLQPMLWILLAAIGGRVMAMGLNRIIDVDLDARNSRTRLRALPRKAMQRSEAWLIVGAAGALYLGSAAALSPLCVWLSPVPIALFVLYPYLKRFTVLSHLGLGLAWSMAPLGGWLAAAGSLERIGEIGWLWVFAVLWVAGFDIIYATMDEAFDRASGLHSLPARLGQRAALRIAAVLHLLAFASLVMLWRVQTASPSALMWLAAVGGVLIWEHLIAMRRPQFAFFQCNILVGFLILTFVLVGT